MLTNSTFNFGPAHPAAHGVFRLIILTSSEVIMTMRNYFGLLFRCSEILCETRWIELLTGYFARLDYVAFLAIEFGLSSSTFEHSNVGLDVSLILNSVGNHLLNLSTTLVDLGLVSALLWTFEIRELFAELSDKLSGARLHVNTTTANLCISPIIIFRLFECFWSTIFVLDILAVSSISTRISRNRLNKVLSIRWEFAWGENLSGPVAESAGLLQVQQHDKNSILTINNVSVGGGLQADSLFRFLARLRYSTLWLASVLLFIYPTIISARICGYYLYLN